MLSVSEKWMALELEPVRRSEWKEAEADDS